MKLEKNLCSSIFVQPQCGDQNRKKKKAKLANKNLFRLRNYSPVIRRRSQIEGNWDKAVSLQHSDWNFQDSINREIPTERFWINWDEFISRKSKFFWKVSKFESRRDSTGTGESERKNAKTIYKRSARVCCNSWTFSSSQSFPTSS